MRQRDNEEAGEKEEMRRGRREYVHSRVDQPSNKNLHESLSSTSERANDKQDGQTDRHGTG